MIQVKWQQGKSKKQFKVHLLANNLQEKVFVVNYKYLLENGLIIEKSTDALESNYVVTPISDM